MNFTFDAQEYKYASRRRVVHAKRGMVCTSQPLASQAGLTILQQGGNAIDAAIATAICQTIVEPTNNGLGSDCFALVWTGGKLYGLNGSGYAPQRLTPEAVAASGATEKMPLRGWEAVTVPGAPSAWAELHKRFGRLPFAKLFEPAIYYAEQGYPVSPIVARFWQEGIDALTPYKNNPAIALWFATFDVHGNGVAPQTGELVTLPDHAKTLRILADSYCESYYRGELAQRLVEFSDKTGGYLSLEDLADYRAEWVEPVHINYHGYDVWEMPPNGHGITALMALNILKGMEIGAKDTGDTFHKQIEAMKLAFADGMHYIADPRYMHTRVEELLSDAYAAQRRALIGETALEPTHGKPFCGGTVYLCTADGEGNMVSFIQSNYKDFGSGIVLPGYGINLNDRGAGFSLNPELDDYLAPRKKPYHTIIPGFLTHEGEAVGPFGVMGAYMQPQGHVQVIMNTVDWLLNPQTALDAPRWQWIAGKEIWLESSVAPEIVEDLRRRGHEVRVLEDDTTFGRGEIIWRDSNGVLAGATEPRADGVVAAW
ncbi:gamma-glutamyltransferase family protein [uncultured Phascolarctobacterium sp.]|jgi:gamma-glutamyltranspeptidase/glutathione hydrolase|uniref:gamma-glutamyltransferase family protein n=1 Tax=uncultured Phascolarctobacterium sp. TaxID=512296 RepID=UPI0025DD1B20|nr:gamma-glutamyltransferase family protein [uncultured Phascolarctobacterium sp.]